MLITFCPNSPVDICLLCFFTISQPHKYMDNNIGQTWDQPPSTGYLDGTVQFICPDQSETSRLRASAFCAVPGHYSRQIRTFLENEHCFVNLP